VRNSDPAAENHRDWLRQKIRDNGFYSQLTTALLKLERQIHLATTSRQAVPPLAARPAESIPNAAASSRPVMPAAPSYPAPISPTIPAPSPFPVQKKTVNELAAEAIKASQRLREIILTSDSQEKAVLGREDGFSVPFAR
jgi:hypothetical protein